MRPLRGLQENRVATREESGVLGFPSRGVALSKQCSEPNPCPSWAPAVPTPCWLPQETGTSSLSSVGGLLPTPQPPTLVELSWVSHSLSGIPTQTPLGGTRRVGGLLGVAGRLSGTVSPFRAEQGTSLETPSRARVKSRTLAETLRPLSNWPCLPQPRFCHHPSSLTGEPN